MSGREYINIPTNVIIIQFNSFLYYLCAEPIATRPIIIYNNYNNNYNNNNNKKKKKKKNRRRRRHGEAREDKQYFIQV
jgi:hypothetical protein